MKHVGLNVVADPLFTCSYTGVKGGMIIVSTDDLGLHSSQDEQDNRYYARAALITMVEPSDLQKCINFVGEVLSLSEKYDMPVLFRLTTRVSHSKSVINLDKQRMVVRAIPYKLKEKFNPVPAVSQKLYSKVDAVLLTGGIAKSD